MSDLNAQDLNRNNNNGNGGGNNLMQSAMQALAKERNESFKGEFKKLAKSYQDKEAELRKFDSEQAKAREAFVKKNEAEKEDLLAKMTQLGSDFNFTDEEVRAALA